MQTTKLTCLLIVLIALAAPAAAQEGGDAAARPVADSVVRPHWLRRPDAGDLARHYPKAGAGVTGNATVRCLIDESGRFSSCEVTRETPEGHGFGAATIELAKLFKMSPVDGDGLSVAGRHLNLPVRWDPPR